MGGKMNNQDEILLEIKNLVQRLVDRFELVHRDEIRLAKERAEQSMGDKNSTKRRIYELIDGKRGVVEIAKLLKTSQPNVSIHIKDLLEAGLVSAQDERGRRIYRKKWEV